METLAGADGDNAQAYNKPDEDGCNATLLSTTDDGSVYSSNDDDAKDTLAEYANSLIAYSKTEFRSASLQGLLNGSVR